MKLFSIFFVWKSHRAVFEKRTGQSAPTGTRFRRAAVRFNLANSKTIVALTKKRTPATTDACMYDVPRSWPGIVVVVLPSADVDASCRSLSGSTERAVPLFRLLEIEVWDFTFTFVFQTRLGVSSSRLSSPPARSWTPDTRGDENDIRIRVDPREANSRAVWSLQFFICFSNTGELNVQNDKEYHQELYNIYTPFVLFFFFLNGKLDCFQNYVCTYIKMIKMTWLFPL